MHAQQTNGNPSSAPRFNLVDEGFISCVQDDGTQSELGLRTVLVESHRIREVRDSSPLVVISLHRLLLAILHRTFGPRSLNDWKQLWHAGKWDHERLGDYLGRWRHRFDLFDHDRPFYQVASLEDSETHSIAQLAQELASGNNATLFDHRLDSVPDLLSAKQAARYLIAFQNFAIGFGKSQPFYFADSPLVRGFTVMVQGGSLFQTLAMNLVLYNKERPLPWPEGAEDKPAWEQDSPARPEREGTNPRGYVDYLTWQSRRIRLIPTSSPAEPSVSQCQIRQNLALPKGALMDPMKCYRLGEKKERIALSLSADRALWRDSHSLFQISDDSYKRPDLFNWIARAKREGAFDTMSKRSVLNVFGFATESGKAASVILWRHEQLPVPLAYVDDDALVARLKDAITAADEVGGVLHRTAWFWAKLVLLPEEDKQPGKQQRAEIDSLASTLALERSFWPRLEEPFRKLLEELPGEQRARALDQWRATLRRTAREVFVEVTRSLDTSARTLKAVVAAQSYFNRELNRILPKGGEAHEPTD